MGMFAISILARSRLSPTYTRTTKQRALLCNSVSIEAKYPHRCRHPNRFDPIAWKNSIASCYFFARTDVFRDFPIARTGGGGQLGRDETKHEVGSEASIAPSTVLNRCFSELVSILIKTYNF